MNLWASESVIRSPSLDEFGVGSGEDDVQEVVEAGVDDLIVVGEAVELVRWVCTSEAQILLRNVWYEIPWPGKEQ